MLCPCVDLGFDFGTLGVDICVALFDTLSEVGILKHPIDPGIPTYPPALRIRGISVIDVAEAQIEVPNGPHANFFTRYPVEENARIPLGINVLCNFID